MDDGEAGFERTATDTANLRAFRAQLGILMVLYTVVVFSGIYAFARAQMLETLEAQAASYFELVMTAREWNSSHGGVWVFDDGLDEANAEYLEAAGIEHTLTSDSGQSFTLRNPSEMTREISELTSLESGVAFHLVGAEPINPLNAPDSWEQPLLAVVEQEGSPRSEIYRESGTAVYRYMAPLLVEETCIACHTKAEGYEVGGRKGAVSLSIPMTEFDAGLRQLAIMLITLGITSIAGGLTATNLLTSRLGKQVSAANEQLRRIAVTDPLTGILNRRAAIERLELEFARARRTNSPLSLITMDLDNFKRINDRHGHPAGDCALVEFVERLRESLRPYDIFGRMGGEEFLVVAPGARLNQAAAVAERALDKLRSAPLTGCALNVTLTASAGVVQMLETDPDCDALMTRADRALYAAKNGGRDRVSYDPEPDA